MEPGNTYTDPDPAPAHNNFAEWKAAMEIRQEQYESAARAELLKTSSGQKMLLDVCLKALSDLGNI